MKYITRIVSFALSVCILISCESKSENTTEHKTTVTETTDTLKKKDDGVNVSLNGRTSVDISGDGGKVETKSGTDIQVNKQGVKVNSKDVNVNIGNRN